MIKKRSRKILVPIDGSSDSFDGLDEAIYIARQCNSTITGLFVISIYPKKLSDLVNPVKIKIFENARHMMDKAEIASAQNGIVFHKKIEYGDPKSVVLEAIRRGKFDLVVIGNRGLGPVRNALLGSLSNSVLHVSKTPVLIVK